MVFATGTLTNASVTTINFPNYAQSGPIYPNATADAQTSAASQASWARYINVTSAPLSCLSFREVYVLDNTLTNVALFKPTSQGSAVGTIAGYRDPYGFTSYAAYGVDGIIDMDNATAGNLVNLPCDGSAWWAVDLGGVYNIARLVLFNRFPLTSPITVGEGFGANTNGAMVTLRNGYGAVIGAVALTGDMIQSVPVTLQPPTNTPSVGASFSVSPTMPATSSATGAPPSASLTPNASPWVVNGASTYVTANSGTLPIYVTPGTASAVGSAFLVQRQWADEWTVTGSFKFDLASSPAADGMAIVVQNGANPSLVGSANGGTLGYYDTCGSAPCFVNSIAIRFASYSVGRSLATLGMWYGSDGTVFPNGTLVAGYYREAGEFVTDGYLTWYNGNVFTFTLSYALGTLSMFVSDATLQNSGSYAWPVNLPALICPGQTAPGCPAFFGVTGSTGTYHERHQVSRRSTREGG